MIISCINCNKKFNINSELIPANGKLLECGSCNHQWFFKKNVTNNDPEMLIVNEENLTENISINNENLDELTVKVSSQKKAEKKVDSNKTSEIKKIKNNKILNLTLVFIISFVALIILIDTFKYPIGKIIPNIEFILYSLYESLKDIELFIKDLI
tara:strand:- start:89 stop:553 length:465 start_codon:yes stop_codon:yes gene_type:complete